MHPLPPGRKGKKVANDILGLAPDRNREKLRHFGRFRSL